jgi:nitrogen fixation NifU-like protein
MVFIDRSSYAPHSKQIKYSVLLNHGLSQDGKGPSRENPCDPWLILWFSHYNELMNDMETGLRERLRNIYSEITIDHIIHPRNADRLPDPDGFAACCSDCGETMKIWLRIRNNLVENAGFWTDGCVATVASGSMATDLIKGKTLTQALGLRAQDIADALVDLPEGNFHCAELASHAVSVALRDYLSIQQQPWKRLYRK